MLDNRFTRWLLTILPRPLVVIITGLLVATAPIGWAMLIGFTRSLLGVELRAPFRDSLAAYIFMDFMMSIVALICLIFILGALEIIYESIEGQLPERRKESED